MEAEISSASEPSSPISNPSPRKQTKKMKSKSKSKKIHQRSQDQDLDSWLRRAGGGGSVMLEGYVESDGGDSTRVERTKSLTDEDLEDLKGCLDLGFGFNYDEIPELCNTLPALELCYSMSRFLDDQQRLKVAEDEEAADGESCCSNGSGDRVPIANWKFSSPGDHPDDVKARLKYWAQAVACTVRLCS